MGLIMLSWCVTITIFCSIVCLETVASGPNDVSNNQLKCADVQESDSV